MLLHAGLALHAAWRTSPTIDEFSHVPAGISYWQTGRFGLYHHNPPLAKLLAALPVLVAHPVVDYSGSYAQAQAAGEPPGHVAFAEEFMRANAARYFDLFRLARIPIVLLSLAGMLILFHWGRELFGAWGGLLAAAIWAFEPNLIAHAGVATTDMAATVLILAAVETFRRFLAAATLRGALLSGTALGLALLTKFTALFLLPLFALFALLRRPRGRSWVLVPCVALFVLNAGYLFEGTGRPLGSFPFLSSALTRQRTGGVPPHREARFYQMLFAQRQNRFEGTLAGRLPSPVPAEYLLGLDEQSFEASPGLPGGGYAVSLRGEVRRGGWWWYDLYALLVKLPLAVWVLGLLAIVAAISTPAARRGMREEAFWIAPTVLLISLMSVMTGLDLGVRYLLPAFPFLFLGIARLAATPRPIVPAILLGALAISTLRVHPHELSYFNELAGGPSRGGRHLLDSNLDWGQDLLELKRVLDRRLVSGDAIGLAYFGAVDPALAGMKWFVPPRDPRTVPPGHAVPSDGTLRPGLYAVSVNFLYGLPHRVRGPDGSSIAVDEGAFAYFRRLAPIGRAGYSIELFEVSAEDATRLGYPPQAK
jgi:hypothetical protein